MAATTSSLSHAPHLRTIIESALHFNADEPEMFVFGYGSLIWHAGFEYTTSTKAHITGWARRFHHGNVTFRGTVEKPGRVVTLIADAVGQSVTPGILFRLVGASQIAAAMKHLYYRECENGYSMELVTVSIGDVMDATTTRTTISAITCIARETDDYWLGETSMQEMAANIYAASGKSGLNRSYLYDLVAHSRRLWPDYHDDHLYTLYALVKQMELAE